MLVVWLLAIAVAIATFALYVATLAPGITWSSLGADGGDLLTAAFTWGIPHPSGYPTYLLALRAFSTLMPAGEPAFRGNLMSAFFAALAGALVFVAAARIAIAVTAPTRLSRLQRVGRPKPTPVWIPLGAALSAALAAGTAREMWSQATITEVYALNAFFAALILLGAAYLLVRKDDRAVDRWLLAGLSLALGVGLGNHLTLALAAGPLLAFAAFERWDRDGRSAKTLLITAVPFLAGFSVYLYAPIASSRLPPLNWGHPHTPQGFWWMISGSIYRDYAFGIETRQLPGRVVTAADFFLAQYTVVGLWLGLAGLYLLWVRLRRFAVATAIAVGLISLYAIGYDTPDSYLYLIPAFLIFAVWIAAGIAWGAGELYRFVNERTRIGWSAGPATILSIAAAGVVMTALSIYSNASTLNLRHDRASREFARSAFETAGPESVILAADTERVFSLWYQTYIAEPDLRIAVVSLPHMQFDWYWDDLDRQFPELLPDERPKAFNARIDALVAHNLGITPIFAASQTGILDRYKLVPDGAIFRIDGTR